MTVTMETDERGRAVACKWASGDGVARLRHEAEVLEAARHPGVVELLDVRFDGGSASLRLAAAAGPSLDRCPALTGDEAAGIVAAVAATVADLHAAGIVHRAIEAAHVVLDGDGRPLLCGFADAVVVGAAADEAGEARDADAAVDVAALGALLLALAGAAPAAAGRPDPGAEALAAIARWASSPDPASRPSAGDLAAAIAARVPAARLPRPADLAARGQQDGGDGAVLGRLLERAPAAGGDEERRGEQDARGGRRRAAPVAAVRVAAAVVALAGFASGMSGGPPAPAPPVTASDTPSSSTTSVASTAAAKRVRATRVWPGPPSSTTTPTTTAGDASLGCPPVDAELRADVDGDGCVEALTYAAGVLSAGSTRWAVGGAGDRVATGDWWCRGEERATLAVLRAADRSVWVFEGWPAEAGVKVAAQRWGTVGGATRLQAEPGSGGCAVLTVERVGQPPVTLAPPRSAR